MLWRWLSSARGGVLQYTVYCFTSSIACQTEVEQQNQQQSTAKIVIPNAVCNEIGK